VADLLAKAPYPSTQDEIERIRGFYGSMTDPGAGCNNSAARVDEKRWDSYLKQRHHRPVG
jgi:hypothetical protein